MRAERLLDLRQVVAISAEDRRFRRFRQRASELLGVGARPIQLEHPVDRRVGGQVRTGVRQISSLRKQGRFNLEGAVGHVSRHGLLLKGALVHAERKRLVVGGGSVGCGSGGRLGECAVEGSPLPRSRDAWLGTASAGVGGVIGCRVAATRVRSLNGAGASRALMRPPRGRAGSEPSPRWCTPFGIVSSASSEM
eukprot:2034172-Pleurochrysis_carterae.AAC.1